jgi:transglutaminase-like putative cysteine protease
LLGAPAAHGGVVSREAPPEYHRQLEAQLDRSVPPWDATEFGGEDGVVLLDEEVHLVNGSGRVVAAIHRRLRPTSYAGTRRVDRIAIPFRPGTEAAHLVLARRIRPDGRIIPVRDDAVLYETPQLLVDLESYADVAQIVILFPGVQPGDVVEYIAVKEFEPIISGEYAEFLPVADPWRQVRSRRKILLPGDMARRLRSKPLGLGDVHPESRPAQDGLTTLIWDFSDQDAVRMEHGRQPIRQAGPGIWLSTIGDWSDVGAWFLQLLEGSNDLDEELDRLTRRWRGSARDPLEVARAVNRYVSENVEYLALEFGMGSFRPKPASQVWESRFGDCKDQANLVRVLLGALGIPSYLALVNTQHAGLIEKSIPDYSQFNHVLVAVPDGDGRYVFLDPTSPPLVKEGLPYTAMGREALVLLPDKSAFVTIPAGSAGELAVEFDLQLTPLGQLHGRLRILGRGLQGARLVDTLVGSPGGPDEDELDRFLGRFVPHARVLEVEEISAEHDDGERVLEMYVWSPAANENRIASLVVPFAKLLLPELGEECRQTRFYQPQGTLTVRAVYHLPKGSHFAADPPAEIDIGVSAVKTRAGWKRLEDRLEGEVSYETSVNSLGPAAFAALFEVRSRLQQWLTTPVAVHLDECSLDDALEACLADLPRLRTAAGQLRLVDALFPDAEDRARRRAALVKVTDWFPDDPSAVFEARAELAVLDQREGRFADSIRDLREILDRYGDGVDEESRGWVEYLLADGLRMTGRTAEARGIYDRLSRSPGLSVHRRGWAYARAAYVRRHSAPLEALAILEEGTQLDSPALPQQVVLLVELLSEAPLEVTSHRLESIGRQHPHRIPEIHERLADEVASRLDDGETGRAERLVELLAARIESNADLSFLAERTSRLRRMVRESIRCAEIAQGIRSYFGSHMPAGWSVHDGKVEGASRERLIAALERLDRAGQAEEFVRISVEVVTRFNLNPDFFGFLLFRCAHHLNTAECCPELRDQFLVWCEELPEANRFRVAAVMLQRSIDRQGKSRDSGEQREASEP